MKSNNSNFLVLSDELHCHCICERLNAQLFICYKLSKLIAIAVEFHVLGSRLKPDKKKIDGKTWSWLQLWMRIWTQILLWLKNRQSIAMHRPSSVSVSDDTGPQSPHNNQLQSSDRKVFTFFYVNLHNFDRESNDKSAMASVCFF